MGTRFLIGWDSSSTPVTNDWLPLQAWVSNRQLIEGSKELSWCAVIAAQCRTEAKKAIERTLRRENPLLRSSSDVVACFGDA